MYAVRRRSEYLLPRLLILHLTLVSGSEADLGINYFPEPTQPRPPEEARIGLTLANGESRLTATSADYTGHWNGTIYYGSPCYFRDSMQKSPKVSWSGDGSVNRSITIQGYLDEGIVYGTLFQKRDNSSSILFE